MMDEARQKNERKAAGVTAIQQWQTERQGQIQLRKQNNDSHEQQFHTRREEERRGNNPWDRVTENCDLTQQGVNQHGHDKTRMKQAMLNRKADIHAGEAVLSGNFGMSKASE